MTTRFIFLSAFLLLITSLHANIRLPAVLGDNMVLQRNATVKLWGWGEPNEKIVITTSWNGRIDSVRTNETAKWQISVATPAAGGPFTITFKGYNTVVLQNIMIGEVWVCSGQSNMEMNFRWGIPQMKADIASANKSAIRFFTVPKATAQTPQERGEGAWLVSDTNTVKSFSAVAYYFGEKLQAELNVPIGLIQAAWGGTPAEVWTPANVVEGDVTLQTAALKLKKANGWPIAPGSTYNAMIAPVEKYEIAGAIWYQGESNTETASTYQQLFSSMIKSWRQKWGKEFPFYYVQLAPFTYGNNLIGAQLREAQTKTLLVPKTGMV
ncbi:MAG TPA: sialate O-acetylesterase, partial [Flavisolibacter sp.]|nr:sialate O-acetylesterase [Flavisolibacter sp.]